MKEINLREYYPELYTEDYRISVSDEIEEMMRRSILEEKAYQRRLCRYQAYYSLDYSLTAENERDLLDDEAPEDLQEQKERRRKLQKAFRTLTPSQQRRIYKRYFLCMSCAEIARSEGCTISAVCNSIHRSLKKLKRITIYKSMLKYSVTASTAAEFFTNYLFILLLRLKPRKFMQLFYKIKDINKYAEYSLK